jgi:competence protein ComEA
LSTQITSGKLLTAVIIFLLLIITISGIIIWLRYQRGDPVIISYSTTENWDGTIFIGGGVNLPGYYPFTDEDTIETLIQAAGGMTDNHGSNNVTLLFESSKRERQTQKIDINHAEKWLLEALPGIGEIIAQRIIDFRMENGRFTSTLELLEVDGIGTFIYESIKEYITVSD